MSNNKLRNNLLDARKTVPVWNIAKRQELANQIAALAEDIAAMEAALKKLEEQEGKYSAELESVLQQYRERQEQATEYDPDELTDARLQLRPGMDRSAVSGIQTTYGKRYSPCTMAEAREDISKMLGEDEEPRSVRDRLRKPRKEQSTPRKKEQDRDR